MVPLSEFEIIARYFTTPTRERQGVGDDCALIDVGGATLALTADLLHEGVHFYPGADPRSLGHKALAVNLSDLAAAGARPRCFLLSLALPAAHAHWLAAFSEGMLALAREQGCELIGGDTTRAQPAGAASGPLTIAITAIGDLPAGTGRSRAGARPGDEVWVSGALGEAALSLAHVQGKVRLADAPAAACRARMDRPQPRVALGLALNGIASASMDVSDGLVGDIAHLLRRSGVRAELEWECFPQPAAFSGVELNLTQTCVLSGGDDYELLFTAPSGRHAAVLAAGEQCAVPVTCLGRIVAGTGLVVRDGAGRDVGATLKSFDHFG